MTTPPEPDSTDSARSCWYVVVERGWTDDAAHPHVHATHGPWPDRDGADEALTRLVADPGTDTWRAYEISPLYLPNAPNSSDGWPASWPVSGGGPPQPGAVVEHPTTGWRWTLAHRAIPDSDGVRRDWVMTSGPPTGIGCRYTAEQLVGFGVRPVLQAWQQVVR